jgi:serine/threonine-protein kinase HipA
MFRDGTQSWIAKFPTSDDPFNIVGAEAASLYLARLAGLDVPGSRVLRAVGKDVLLVERFDRTPEPGRIMAVSGLTLLGLGELEGRYGSYPELLGAIQDKAADPVGTGRELFSRIAFNIAVSNTDDHLRNHAALWDGKTLRLSPAFDLAPGVRHGETSYQAIPYGLNGERESRFAGLIRCAGAYGLSSAEAAAAVESLVDCIEANWADATDAARLSAADRALLWRNQILHPAASYGLVNAS